MTDLRRVGRLHVRTASAAAILFALWALAIVNEMFVAQRGDEALELLLSETERIDPVSAARQLSMDWLLVNQPPPVALGDTS